MIVIGLLWLRVMRQSKKAAAAAAAAEKVATEVVKLGPTVKEGEIVFGVCHIYASFNDTFVVRLSTRC